MQIRALIKRSFFETNFLTLLIPLNSGNVYLISSSYLSYSQEVIKIVNNENMSRKIVYARVSTNDQELNLQIDALLK
ncbi:MAG: hypothetical protein ACJAT7_003809 [Psychromonas sp.]|jgi:hypothetical protein